MCTLIALFRCVPGAPLVVAANRDEYLDRPAEGLAIRETPNGRIVAPRDQKAGGTWLGLNASGALVAVTNRRTDAPDPARRSRGLLVMDVLSTPTAEEAAGRIERLPHAAYNPFNLFVADSRTAHLFTYVDQPERFDLAPGAHVVGNIHPKEATPKVSRIEREVRDLVAVGADRVLDRLADACRSHAGESPLEATCVHAGGYGTRSSMLLRLGRAPELRYAEGEPCAHDYDDFTPLLVDLGLPGDVDPT
jgi:uncharacterized protein with NRDE domain